MKLIVTPTNKGSFAEAMAFALWAYLHRCCKHLGSASIIGDGKFKSGFVGQSEVTQVPVTLSSGMWRVAGRTREGKRAICFLSVQVGDHEPDNSESMEYLSLWPEELLFLKVVGSHEVHWSTSEEALAYLDGNEFPAPL